MEMKVQFLRFSKQIVSGMDHVPCKEVLCTQRSGS